MNLSVLFLIFVLLSYSGNDIYYISAIYIVHCYKKILSRYR